MTAEARYQLAEELERYLSGDSQRFAWLRVKLSRYVARRFPCDAAEIDDLVSEIIAIALISLRKGQFRGDSIKAFNAYLYGIARLKILQAVERAGKLHEVSQHIISANIPVARTTDPATRVGRGDLLKKVYDELGDPCRDFMRLKFIHGWSDQEIANHKGMSKNAVSTAISRCLSKARQLRIVRELL